MLKILLLLTTFCVLASNGRKRVSELATDDVIWTTTEQLLDNFNPIDNRTFYTRNLENGQFYERGGPIIVYIGGEWTIEEYGVKGGIAFQLAKRHKGYLFYPEHRYYGLSTPHYFKPKEEYRYHSTEQALADLANSIYQLKRRIQSLKNSQVIALGASYSGGMALWARMKYPHLLNVIYACGPVVYLPTENKSYHDISFKTYRRENETCARIIREAFDEARLLLSSDDGKRWFYGIMKNWVCVQESMVDPIPDILQSLFTTLNVQLSFHKDVPASCSNLLHNTSGTPLERLAQNLPLFMASANTKYCRNNDTRWEWLVCNGLGTFTSMSESNFGEGKPLDYQIKSRCADNFGLEYNTEHAAKVAERMKIMYGRDYSDLTKVIFVQGTNDPWLPVSVMEDLNEDFRVLYIEGASHCSDIGEEQDEEDPRISQAKIDTYEALAQWID